MGVFSQKSRRIVVHGHIGRGNVGDEAMLEVIVRVLRDRFPEHELCLAYGEDTKPRTIDEGTVSYFARSFSAIIRQLRYSEAFVIAGGTHLTCFGRDRRGKLAGILRQALLLFAARLFGNKVLMLSVGIGPLETSLSRLLVRVALSAVHFVSVRDDASLATLGTLRYKHAATRCPDAAYLVSLPDKLVEQPKRLGISVLPYFTSHMNEPARDEKLVESIVDAIHMWLDQFPEGEVCLIPLCTQAGAHSDTVMTGRIAAAFSTDGRVRAMDIYGSPTAFLACLATLSHFIAMRYHAMLFAHAMHLPTLTIAYHAKNTVLAAELGLPDDTVIRVEDALGDALSMTVRALCDAPNHFVAPRSVADLKVDAILPEGIHHLIGLTS